MPHGPDLTQYVALDVDHPECIAPELQTVLDLGGYAVNETSESRKVPRHLEDAQGHHGIEQHHEVPRARMG